jgi:hypothetical protein
LRWGWSAWFASYGAGGLIVLDFARDLCMKQLEAYLGRRFQENWLSESALTESGIIGAPRHEVKSKNATARAAHETQRCVISARSTIVCG